MRRRFRILRILKWSGTLVCALLAAAFLLSLAWTISYYRYGSKPQFALQIDSGKLILVVPRHLFPSPESNAWQIEDSGRQGWDWTWLWTNPLPQKPYPWIALVTLPLLPISLLFLAPTLLLWFLDRRRPPPGHCRRCNYDLTGNLSGVCPECGAAAQSEPHAG